MMGGAHRGEDREHADGADRKRNHEAMTGRTVCGETVFIILNFAKIIIGHFF